MTTAASIELKKFGEQFNGRLSKEELNYALNYINFGEESLAFEILCDYICENDLSLTKNEYERICRLNTLFNNFLERDVIMYLKALIK